jgi:hypothetical protein
MWAFHHLEKSCPQWFYNETFMVDWLKRQWQDIRGHFKWWVVGTIVTAGGSVYAFFWSWLSSGLGFLR